MAPIYPKTKRNNLREIDADSCQLKLQFGENVLTETNNFEMHFNGEERFSWSCRKVI